MKYAEAIQLRAHAGSCARENIVGLCKKGLFDPFEQVENKPANVAYNNRMALWNGLTAALGIGGAATAGTYGVLGYVPQLKGNKALRLLLAGTVGGIAGAQAGKLAG